MTELLSVPKLLDLIIDKGAIPALAFGVGLAAKPVIRRAKAYWFRASAARHAAVFSDLEQQTITIQAGEPYFRFDDIRLHRTPTPLKLTLPGGAQADFDAQELQALQEQGIGWGEAAGSYLHFKDRASLCESLSTRLGADARERLDAACIAVARQFAHGTGGCLFNGSKYGVLDYRIARSNDEKEFPLLNLYCFDTDYYTDRVLTELWRGLDASQRRSHSELANQRSIAFLSCSLGVNCVVICADDKILITQRSARVGLSTSRLHISMNEGLTQTDRDTGDVPSVRLCLLRGLREELGVRESEIRKMEIGDFFLERHHFQFGLTAVVHLACGSQELRHAVSKDRTLESDGFRFLDFHGTRELLAFLKTERGNFVPHGYYTLLRILLREQPGILKGARSFLPD